MKHRMFGIVLGILLAVMMVSLGNTAYAWSGSVTGTLRFYQHQGNFCQTTVSCTGANYTEASHYHQNLPVRGTKVYIINSVTGFVSGQGVTNASGNFSFNWNDAHTNVLRYLAWRYEHQDGRFRVVSISGSTQTYIGPTFTPTIPADSRSLGTTTVGTSAAPHALANVYDGARMMWDNSLSSSQAMLDYFTGVEIWAFEPAGCLDGAGEEIPGCCPTSCAGGPNKRVRLDSNAAFAPQNRVMHELGHIASYLASPGQEYKSGGNYCYGDADGLDCGGWSSSTPEYGAAQFEEAVATHFSNIALYQPGAATPRQCLSSGACGAANANNLELSLGTGCAADVNRHPIQVMRYLWDVYDTVSDYTGESMGLTGSTTYSYLGGYGTGAGEDGKNEPWNAALNAIDELDGRSGKDFKDVAQSFAGQNTTTQFNNNCSPIGD